MLLAGIWDRWHNPQTDEALESFAVLTAPANKALSFVHNRQPVMLSLADAPSWLDPATPAEALGPLMDSALPVALEVLPVSSYVNNARHKDPRCVEPVADGIPVSAAGVEAAGPGGERL